MSVPFSFITAPSDLTGASDAVESATTDSLQKAECVVPDARQDHVKKPVIPYLRMRAYSTARIAARSQMRETPVKMPYICKINLLVVAVHPFALLISNCYSLFIRSVRRRPPFLALLNSAAPARSAGIMHRIPRNASPRRISQPPFIIAICCPCCKSLVPLLIK